MSNIETNTYSLRYGMIAYLLSFLLCLILLFMCGLIPWITAKYTPDLSILVGSIETVMPNSSFKDSFIDNTSLIYIVYSLFPDFNPEILIRIIQNIAVCLLGFSLLRYLKPEGALSIIFFCFFTVFLNQFRLAIALSFCLIAIKNLELKPKLSFLFFLFSFLFHFFVSIWFILFVCFGYFLKSTFKIKFLILTILFLIGYLVYRVVLDTDELRFMFYLEEDAASSHTYIFAFICLVLLWTTFDTHVKFFLFITVFVSFAVSFLPSLSGRIAELSIISSIFLSKNSYVIYLPDKLIYPNVSPLKLNLVLLFGFIFFIYRYINIVLYNSLGN